ncbi:MAG: M20 family metallopeptidase [Lachnospiraceae bacterium]|nr:M20 family metallopeptidase [Lachnospiraceae bacterium]
MKTEQLQQEIESLYPALCELRHTLHRHPEAGTQEFETDRIITDCLRQWGIPFQMIADTGILAWITGESDISQTYENALPESVSVSHERPGNVVGLRADIDALPIEEAADHICRSENPGMMHACGHDAHTTIQLGVARLLQLHRSEWSGTVKLFFQPAEETIGGAERMVQEGCMKNPAVDYVAGLHVMPDYHTGEVAMKYGKLNAASDEVLIDVYGKGAHGAYPEKGIDAVLIASQLVLSLQSFVSRSLSPLESAVLSFGMINGGSAPNIICDHVQLHGTLRTTDPQTREQAKYYIRTQAKAIASAYGGEATIRFVSGYDALINDDALVDLAADIAAGLLGKEHVHWKAAPSLGVEDFSFFQEHAKAGVFYHLGCTAPDQAEVYPLHTARFQIDDSCLKTGILLQYTLTRRLLEYQPNAN